MLSITARRVTPWVILLALLLTFVRAAPLEIRGNAPSKNVGRLTIGWKGLQKGNKLKRIVSGGGELGKVLYVADSTSLAKLFATSGTHVCEITVDNKEWETTEKHWVSQADIARHKKNMEALYPTSVIFASHTDAGVVGDDEPWQLGIRAGDLDRLKLEGICHPKAEVKDRKISYKGMKGLWNIQGSPERGS